METMEYQEDNNDQKETPINISQLRQWILKWAHTIAPEPMRSNVVMDEIEAKNVGNIIPKLLEFYDVDELAEIADLMSDYDENSEEYRELLETYKKLRKTYLIYKATFKKALTGELLNKDGSTETFSLNALVRRLNAICFTENI